MSGVEIHSRLGERLCMGLPWVPGFTEPQGMLWRPEACHWPRDCAADRCCLQQRSREETAWAEHRNQYALDFRSGRTDIESFEIWAGLVESSDDEAKYEAVLAS